MEHLGELEQLVMLAVLRLGPDAYGGSIQRELAQRAKRRISLGTIYVTLTRLESKALVSSWLGDPTPARGGKAKRYYAVERAGQAALRTAKESLLRMWEGLAPSASPSGSHVK